MSTVAGDIIDRDLRRMDGDIFSMQQSARGFAAKGASSR